MLLSVDNIRQLNQKTIQMSYNIIEKCIEKFFNDLVRYYGILNQKHINLDSSYLPYQYLSIEVIEKVIDLLENKLGYAIIIQKMDNKTILGFRPGDLIQILLYDPLDYDEADVNLQVNGVNTQALYSTFHNFNNLDGRMQNPQYLLCDNFKERKYELEMRRNIIQLGE